jgi:hypothetical protein
MGCLLPIFGLICPRVVMIAIFIATNWFSRGFQTVIWPLVGFFLMPYTTLMYLWASIQTDHNVSGGWIVGIVIAVILDLGVNQQQVSGGE